MRILLDECIDRRFAREFADHEIRTVPQMGWAGIKNGQLMGLAEVSFDVFITVDRNLSYQQNLSKYNVAMIVLKAISNRYIDLAPLAASAHNALQKIRPGESILISLD